MVLRDGSYIDDIFYAGGDSVTVKTWDGRRDESLEWRIASLSEMPREWLREVKGAIESALHAN